MILSQICLAVFANWWIVPVQAAPFDAAKPGNGRAEIAPGYLRQRGAGVTDSPGAAVKWYRLASARQNRSPAYQGPGSFKRFATKPGYHQSSRPFQSDC